MHFEKPKRLAALKKICKRSHFQAVKKDNGIDMYCMKEKTRKRGPWTFGKKPREGRPKKIQPSV